MHQAEGDIFQSEAGDGRVEPYGPPPEILPEIEVGGQRFVQTHTMTPERARSIVEGSLPTEAGGEQ